MVTEHEQRAHANRHLSRDYLASRVGAPPVPPPGGYRGVRRFPSDPSQLPPPGAPAVPPRASAPRPRAHPLGWIALIGVLLFVLVLLLVALSAGPGGVFSTGMLIGQLIVVGLVAAGLCVRRARLVASIALTVALLANIGTVGAASAALAPLSPAPFAGGAERAGPGAVYPGKHDVDPTTVLEAAPLEETQAEGDALMAEVREALSDRFGVTWVQTTDPITRYERNGYGGESLLQEYRGAMWATEQPVQGYEHKLAVIDEINRVLAASEHYPPMFALNDPTQSRQDDEVLEQFYGTTDPRTQAVWEWVTSRDYVLSSTGHVARPPLFYATITDLSNDPTGEFRRGADGTDAPPEGLQLLFLAREQLSEDDRAAFEEGTRGGPPPDSAVVEEGDEE
ncbi:hypothetical protein [Microbacterium sp. gxy059]|uniref:hypothetical protein n=1 Tax=Microbacterium sp. gxy059 TaxID=2957199 RepID=UPI003D958405